MPSQHTQWVNPAWTTAAGRALLTCRAPPIQRLPDEPREMWITAEQTAANGCCREKRRLTAKGDAQPPWMQHACVCARVCHATSWEGAQMLSAKGRVQPPLFFHRFKCREKQPKHMEVKPKRFPSGILAGGDKPGNNTTPLSLSHTHTDMNLWNTGRQETFLWNKIKAKRYKYPVCVKLSVHLGVTGCQPVTFGPILKCSVRICVKLPFWGPTTSYRTLLSGLVRDYNFTQRPLKSGPAGQDDKSRNEHKKCPEQTHCLQCNYCF